MLTIKEAKANFFDRDKITRLLDKNKLKALASAGAMVRTAARRNIRNRKRTSYPGEGPTNRSGLLRDFLFFAYDDSTRSVVIGPAKLSKFGRKDVPAWLEYGKTTVAHEDKTVTYSKVARKSRSGLSGFVKHDKRTIRRGQKIIIEPRPYMQPAFDAVSNSNKYVELFGNMLGGV